MTEPERKPEIEEAQLLELIQSKVTVENVDSGWMIAFILIKAMPVLKEFAENLKLIDSAIAPPQIGQSVSEKLEPVGGALSDIARSFRKLVEAKR